MIRPRPSHSKDKSVQVPNANWAMWSSFFFALSIQLLTGYGLLSRTINNDCSLNKGTQAVGAAGATVDARWLSYSVDSYLSSLFGYDFMNCLVKSCLINDVAIAVYLFFDDRYLGFRTELQGLACLLSVDAFLLVSQMFMSAGGARSSPYFLYYLPHSFVSAYTGCCFHHYLSFLS